MLNIPKFGLLPLLSFSLWALQFLIDTQDTIDYFTDQFATMFAGDLTQTSLLFFLWLPLVFPNIPNVLIHAKQDSILMPIKVSLEIFAGALILGAIVPLFLMMYSSSGSTTFSIFCNESDILLCPLISPAIDIALIIQYIIALAQIGISTVTDFKQMELSILSIQTWKSISFYLSIFKLFPFPFTAIALWTVQLIIQPELTPNWFNEFAMEMVVQQEFVIPMLGLFVPQIIFLSLITPYQLRELFQIYTLYLLSLCSAVFFLGSLGYQLLVILTQGYEELVYPFCYACQGISLRYPILILSGLAYEITFIMAIIEAGINIATLVYELRHPEEYGYIQ
ncbi:hypothetical protein FGO68_gene16446 [Halteria grandinella]|uniref:SecY-independent transporter protein n=1 Tax=Halteria grandinella TaxID=5974 RepID=A0A8J8NLZ9_HALGN|nr:hypothetical protein FGO68_gene16446 [Halteria grandinella]